MESGKVRYSKAERTEQIRVLLEDGANFYQIGQELGLTMSTVRNYAYEIWKGGNPELGEAGERTEKDKWKILNDFKWQWPLACNRILGCYGKATQPVPQHSKTAEKAFWKP